MTTTMKLGISGTYIKLFFWQLLPWTLESNNNVVYFAAENHVEACILESSPILWKSPNILNLKWMECWMISFMVLAKVLEWPWSLFMVHKSLTNYDIFVILYKKILIEDIIYLIEHGSLPALPPTQSPHKSLRNEVLKPGYENPLVQEEQNSKLDLDLDGK